MRRSVFLVLSASFALAIALTVALAFYQDPSSCLTPKEIVWGDASYSITSRDVGKNRSFDFVRDGRVEYTLSGYIDTWCEPYLARIVDARSGDTKLFFLDCSHIGMLEHRGGVSEHAWLSAPPAELRLLFGRPNLAPCSLEPAAGSSSSITIAIALWIALSIASAIGAGRYLTRGIAEAPGA
jgi:hypothetical protein